MCSSPRKIGGKFWDGEGGGGGLLNWVLNGGRVHLVEAYNNTGKWWDCITFSEEIENKAEANEKITILYC